MELDKREGGEGEGGREGGRVYSGDNSGIYMDISYRLDIQYMYMKNQVDQSKKAYCRELFRACWLSAQFSTIYSAIHTSLYIQGFPK